MDEMKYMQVLMVNTPEGKTKEVYLRKKCERSLLRDTVDGFMCRMTRPHQYLYECRYITLGDAPEFHDMDLWYLRHSPVGEISSISYRIDAFDRLFLCATGFYLPTPLTPYD